MLRIMCRGKSSELFGKCCKFLKVSNRTILYANTVDVVFYKHCRRLWLKHKSFWILLLWNELFYWAAVPQSGSFIFQLAAMLQIPRVFPRVSFIRCTCILPRKCKSGPMPPSRAKNWRQKSANPALCPLCARGQPSGMANDKCIIFSVFCDLVPLAGRILKRLSAKGTACA